MSKAERVQVDRCVGNVAQCKDGRSFGQNGCLACPHRTRNDKQRFRNRSVPSIMPWVQSWYDGATLKATHPTSAPPRSTLKFGYLVCFFLVL